MDKDERLDHEREALQDDYEARRAGMLKLAVLMGSVVVLALLAMFAGILGINSAVGTLKENQATLHTCTIALLDESLTGQHNINPPACSKK